MSSRVNAIPKEARAFQGRRAGLVTRCAAAAIDIGVVAAALGATYLGLALVRFIVSPDRINMPDLPIFADLAIGNIAMILYLTVSWRSGGRTYGGHVMGLRVVDRSGDTPGWLLSFVRAVFCVFFPVGLAWVLVSHTNRSVQDVVLRTSVIYDWDMRPRSRVADDALGDPPPEQSDPPPEQG